MDKKIAIENLKLIPKMPGNWHNWIKDACAVGIEAIEKQLPKEPEVNSLDLLCECPDCGCVVYYDEVKCYYCPDCGRAILWIDEAEKALEEREARADYEISRRRDEGQ